MTTFQSFLRWCSKADRYPEIFHLTRGGQLARIYEGDETMEDLVDRSLT